MLSQRTPPPAPPPSPFLLHIRIMALACRSLAVGQRSEQAIFHMPERKVKNFSAISGLQCYLEYIDPVAPIDVYTLHL